MTSNFLYYGDNLDILRRYIKDETIDLIYLDPPFNSQQNYNVLFAEKSGVRSAAQIKAFGDTWKWDQGAAQTYQQVVEAGGTLSETLQGFRRLLGSNNMLAYLVMMAPRLAELWRVLKPTGTIYLHCDPTASHYLKLLMDSIFDVKNFRNEIVWKRSQPKSHVKLRFSRAHDVLLCYAKTEAASLYLPYTHHDPAYIKKFYRYVEPETGRRYQLGDLTNPNPDRPNLVYEFLGVTKVWRWTEDRMQEAYKAGLIVQPQPGAIPRYKRYLDEMEGTLPTDVWDDIEHLHGSHKERLGYPTQKPLALLERIIKASSKEGDIVLDPFCGCGTTIAAAQKLERKWVGIDITTIAINLIKTRLLGAYGEAITKTYTMRGEPTTYSEAQALAEQDKYQFQWWALGLVGARGTEEKKGADQGIDGRLYFHDEAPGGKTKQVIFSVKGGHTSVKDVRDLRGVVEREQAEIGVLITLQEPTQPMRTEATGAGFYQSSWGKHPRLQILTIAELLESKRIDMPPLGQVNITFKKAPRTKGEEPETPTLPLMD
ncbi:MAG: restriction endonuclease [Chloroflexi bacterium]|nr:restriction endonuclease [Ktedonobacteraceae bacterium]MBV9709248.1 restriction endonuclease [Chloroflexota bacterium]